MENSNIKFTSKAVKMSNSNINIDAFSNTNINIRYTAPSRHNITTLQNTTDPRPQWYGIQLAQQQSWQEQRIFAHHQRVRFISSTSTADNSTTDDHDDEEGDTTESETLWRFSHLAKHFSKLEQECFADSFAKVKVNNVQGSEEKQDGKPEWRFVDLARHWERLEQRAFAGSFQAT